MTSHTHVEHVAPDAVAAADYTYEQRKSAVVLRTDGTIHMRTRPAVYLDPEDGESLYVACEHIDRDGTVWPSTLHEHVRYL